MAEIVSRFTFFPADERQCAAHRPFPHGDGHVAACLAIS
jgi:hypothetical protein